MLKCRNYKPIIYGRILYGFIYKTSGCGIILILIVASGLLEDDEITFSCFPLQYKIQFLLYRLVMFASFRNLGPVIARPKSTLRACFDLIILEPLESECRSG